MNIVLIGYRGTGKSEVGKLLAERLNRSLFSLDQLIVERAGKSVPEIVEESGWDHFRDLESEVTADCAREENAILDTGGGVILRPQNVEQLKSSGILFWLKASVETIAERIGADDQRPSLTGKSSFVEEIAEVLEQRVELYRAAAHYQIDTNANSIEEVADEIEQELARRSGAN